MKKQTAVEWLKKELEDYGSNSHLSLDWNTFDELCEQANAMFEKQIINSNRDGVDMVMLEKNWISGKEYFHQTYGGDK
jgi:hypothetical protein